MASTKNVAPNTTAYLGGGTIPIFTQDEINRATDQGSIANGTLYWNSDAESAFMYTISLGHVQIAVEESYHFQLVLTPPLDLTTLAVDDALTYTSTELFDLNWQPGQRIVFQHDSDNRVIGTIDSYTQTETTGTIIFNIDSVTGTGTFAQWTGNFLGNTQIDGRIVVPLTGVFTDKDALDAATGLSPNVGDIAYVENSQGLGTIFGIQTPGWLGGDYWPAGYYIWKDSEYDADTDPEWTYSNEAVGQSISLTLGRLVPDGGNEGEILEKGSAC